MTWFTSRLIGTIREIWLSHGSHEMLTLNLGNVEKLLPAGQFFRINRSIIINLAYLWKVNRKKRVAILKKDGEEFSLCYSPAEYQKT